MPLIFIKRRKEALNISEERSLKLKALWLKDPKSDQVVDLGEWSGAVNQIISIEIEKKQVESKQFDAEAERLQYEKALLKIPIEERAKMLGEFGLCWFMRSGMTEKEIPVEILGKAEQVALEYFKKNPNEIRVPMSVFEPLLFVKFGAKKGSANANQFSSSLADKMVVGEKIENKEDVPF